MALRIFMFTIAASLSGAHFFRGGNYPLLALCLATPLLFLRRKGWSLVLLQLAAYVATANWLVTTLELVQFRQQLGRSWTIAAIILVSVAVFTLTTGLLLNSNCMRDRYPSAE